MFRLKNLCSLGLMYLLFLHIGDFQMHECQISEDLEFHIISHLQVSTMFSTLKE